MDDLNALEFVENPDARCPCVLLLDTSGSMSGSAISALNQGLQAFQIDIQRDDLAKRRVEVAIITFGNGGVQTVQEFVTADQFVAPMLTAGGSTPMGEAINRGLDMVRARKAVYKLAGVMYYRPWVFMITDGEPTDHWQNARDRVHAEEASKGLSFFAVGVQGANMDRLREIAAPTRPPVLLNGLNFVEMFVWLSRSQQRVSAAKPGEQVALAPIGWSSV
jgi:uncharacterized protein YegL